MSTRQMNLSDDFTTHRPATPVFCHQDFLEKLSQHGRDSIGRRTAFLLQRLCVDASRLYYKPVQGVNRGWRRSRLGGNYGSHFYAWWAPRGAAPLREGGGFDAAPEGAVFVRDIRHHDDHSTLGAHSFDTHYMPVTVRDLRTEEYAPHPMTQPQTRFAASRQTVRLLKGHPGSGKTTALWHAADLAGIERVLYVTYSRDLATLARQYFDRFCSAGKNFHVITFPHFVRWIAGADAAQSTASEALIRFRQDIAAFSRTLGPWSGSPAALYDELHAHIAGDALPVSIGRFGKCSGPRVPEKAFRERRIRNLGPGATAAALDAAARLERLDPAPLADRYFPELALAWRALEALLQSSAPTDTSLFSFDCIAVDEVQDLTPLESLLIAELAARINRTRGRSIPLLLAGDEAQTVRPTDFEWGWLSDIVHTRVGPPVEYKLAANLRSPRRIAEVVNQVWDLYSCVGKQERPSGSGLAEIDDESTDQILYGTAAPGSELAELLQTLASREGIAIISLEDTVPGWVPEPMRGSVLTVAEAKGLDFPSVCVLNAGHHVERIVREDTRLRADSDIHDLKKRLAIDQLRVALSRPAERLIWLDVNPDDQVVRRTMEFLNRQDGAGGVSSCVPSALLKALEEDELDVEERVLRCQADARQYLQVRPELAWSRAKQAVTLMGREGSPGSVTDQEARRTAWLTLAEICFTLAIRNTRLAPELGRPDLFREARNAANLAGRIGLPLIIDLVAGVHRATYENRLAALARFAESLPRVQDAMEPWVRVEIAPKLEGWLDQLESALSGGHNAGILIRILPPFYDALGMPDRQSRIARVQGKAIQLLIRDKQYAAALDALRALPERQPRMEATCLEGLGELRSAAECYEQAGNLKEAVNCYRSVPDFAAALRLMKQIGDHPATDSLLWIESLDEAISRRPEKFTKVVTPAEKKHLEQLLERALGVTRKKPAPRKAAAKKTTAPKKNAPKKSSAYF